MRETKRPQCKFSQLMHLVWAGVGIAVCLVIGIVTVMIQYWSSSHPAVKIPISTASHTVAEVLLQTAMDYHKSHLWETEENVLPRSVMTDHQSIAHADPNDNVENPDLPYQQSECKEDKDDCICIAKFLRWTEELKYITLQGQKRMRRIKAIIGGLVHNNEKTLAKDVEFLHRMGRRFLDYKILLVENDSKDGTAAVMNELCLDARLICVMIQLHLPGSAFWGNLDFHRFATLASVRNRGLDHLRDLRMLGQLDGFDILMWTEMDLTDHNDGLNPMFELDSVATTFGRPDNSGFDLICANGVIEEGQFRDTLPLVSFEPEFRDVPRGGVWVHNMHDIRDGISFIPVETCFGGLGIYNFSTLMDSGCRYHPETGVCEHLSLHRCMKENGLNRIYVNPAMVVYFEPFDPHICIHLGI